MNPKAEELIARTRAFTKAVIALCERVPKTQAGLRITSQLIDSETSVASNYRASCRARSKREFISKIGQVVEEADESLGWLQMLVDNHLLSADTAAAALGEANELTAIFAASLRTAKENAAADLAEQQEASTRRTRVRKSPITK